MKMPPSKMFVPQEVLETWAVSGAADVTGNTMDLASAERSYELLPAVRFERLIAGADDSNLLGRIMGEAGISEHDGELMGDSVVFGEVAFEVTPGFIATIAAGSN